MRPYLIKSIRLLTTRAAVASLLVAGSGHAIADSANNSGNGNVNGNGNGNGNTSASASAIATASSSLASIATQAGSSLNLAGVVPVSCSIAIAATAKATSLDLKTGEQGVTVGVITENCNSSAGYTVAISSQTGGQLRSVAGDATAPLTSYTASYDDATGSIASGLSTTRKSAFFGRTGNLVVSIPANAQAIAGNYSDSITVVIAAK